MATVNMLPYTKSILCTETARVYCVPCYTICFSGRLGQYVLRVRQQQKPVLVSNFTCKNKNGSFVKEINTSSYIVAWPIYMLHIDKFAPKHTIFSLLSSMLISHFEYLPGLILFTS